MYTAFNLNIELKKETPKDVINVLKYMMGDYEIEKKIPHHNFFRTERWEMLFVGNSVCFPFKAKSQLTFDDLFGKYFLSILSQIKNYNSEIEEFLDWIKPYSEMKGFCGYWIEENEYPNLIFLNKTRNGNKDRN